MRGIFVDFYEWESLQYEAFPNEMITPKFLNEDNFIEVQLVVLGIAFLLDLLILFDSFIFNVVF